MNSKDLTDANSLNYPSDYIYLIDSIYSTDSIDLTDSYSNDTTN